MIVVIGGGVAGLSSALAVVREGGVVTLVVPGELRGSGAGERGSGGSTALAQGGIAAAIGEGDSAAAHLADTVAAGHGLVDIEAAALLTREGAAAVRRLISRGFAADRGPSGAVSLGLEAAHSRPRIVHAAGDRTGAVLREYLVGEVLSTVAAGQLRVLEHRVLAEPDGYPAQVCGPTGHPAQACESQDLPSLIVEGGKVRGVRLRVAGAGAEQDLPGMFETLRAEAVVLATGGYAGLWERSTNPVSSRGDGIVAAARVGAVVADLEFVQFHPTVLSGTGDLISEAVRGAGAVLRDGAGRRYMPEADPRGELAPRDVVSRETQRVLAERGEETVWLDATSIEQAEGAGALARRFPGISAMLTQRGYDWSREPVPVSPAAHYTMGGVATDLDGRSSVPGLFVAGEAASTGVHGANRLASNSLLEGLVFGDRAGVAAARFAEQDRLNWPTHGEGIRALLQHAETRTLVDNDAACSPLAQMISVAATERTESRGAHQRIDCPETDPKQAGRRAYRFSFAQADSSTFDTLFRSAHHDARTLTPC